MGADPVRPFTRRQCLNRWTKGIVRWRRLREDGDMSMCNYYRGVGTCMGGCWEEPACKADEPFKGWPLAEPWFAWFHQHVGWRIKQAWRQFWCPHPIDQWRPYSSWSAYAGLTTSETSGYCARCSKRVTVTPGNRGDGGAT